MDALCAEDDAQRGDKSPSPGFRERLSLTLSRKRASITAEKEKEKGEKLEKPDSGAEVKSLEAQELPEIVESQEQLSIKPDNVRLSGGNTSPNSRGKDPNRRLAKEGMERIDKTMVDIKRLISHRSKKLDRVVTTQSMNASGLGPDVLDAPNIAVARERIKGGKYVLWIQVFRAKETPTWPNNAYPRVYVTVAVDRVRTVTGRWGGHESSVDHTSPDWNEALTLPLDPNGTDDSVRIRLHTVITMAMDTRHDVAVGKANFPINSIPLCEEIPSDEMIAQLSKTEAQVVSSFDDDEGESTDFTPSRLCITDGQPVRIWLKLKKTERARFPILAGMASMYGKGRGWLSLAMCLVPAENASLGDSFYTEDEGDSEAAAPITFPEPYEKVYFDDTQPCSVHKLNRLLFGDGSKCIAQLFKERNYANVTLGEWDHTQKPPTRAYSYMLPPNTFADASMASETQTMVVDEEGGKVVNVVVMTPDVPYGGCFHNELQYCTSRIDDCTCRLRISHRTVFTKKTMLRSAIDAGAEKGIRASTAQVISVLDGFLRRGISRKPAIQAGVEPQRNYISEFRQVNKVWIDWLRDGSVPAPAFVAVCMLLIVSLLLNYISFSPASVDDMNIYGAVQEKEL